MMTWFLWGYFLLLGFLAVYGLHRYWLIGQAWRAARRPSPAAPAVAEADWPMVTIQLPIYNERYVAERAIRSACAVDYPRERLDIQVLDDSTDDTRQIIDRCVAEARQAGVPIVCLRRGSRAHYKAGALAYGLRRARGEFLAIFDADFLVPREFLRQTIPHLVAAPRLGLVQARWSHINRDYSLLTPLQAILLDGHFMVEQVARSSSGRFFNFNGTAGVWRRRAIVDAGGWQHDTLTEDLDLSYRAQLRGWRARFLPEVVCPAELPVEMNAFKTQQHRWTKGSIQTAMKLLPRILRAPVAARLKLEACLHLTTDLNNPVGVLVALCVLPAMVWRISLGRYQFLLVDLPLLALLSVSHLCFYGLALRRVCADWRQRLWGLPLAMALGVGMLLTNTRAAVEALAGHRSEFVRTPKFHVERKTNRWWQKRYSARPDALTSLELGCAAYFTVAVLYAARRGCYGSLPFLLLFQLGFLYVGGLSLWQRSLFVWRRRPERI